MKISEILDTMDDLLEKAWTLPLSGGKSAVDVERMAELIGEIRLNLPGEIKQAKMIVDDRREIVSDAKKESEQIIQSAQIKAKRLVAEEEIVKQAQVRANQMLAQAHTQANEIKKMTNDYVERILSSSEEALLGNLRQLKEAHTEIRKSSK